MIPRIAILIILIVLIFLAPTTRAQSQIRIDVGTGLGYTIAQTSFGDLPGFPSCCPEYTSGSGVGGLFGVGVDVPISHSFFGSVRLATHDRSHMLTTEERVDVIVGNELTNAAIEHSLALPLTEYGIETHIGWRRESFVVRGGIGYSHRAYGALRSREELKEPVGATFTDTEGTVRNATTGSLPSAIGSTWHFVSVIGLDIRLSKHSPWRLTPEASLAAAFSSVTSSTSWMLIMPAVGLRLSYEIDVRTKPASVPPSPPLPPPVAQAPQAPSKPEPVTPTKKAVKQRVVIEELEEERFMPILPYVFFDRNSASIPSRYQVAPTTSLRDRAQTNVQFHRELLIVIANRMKQESSANIVLTGHIANDETDTQLALRRAKAIASVLESSFGISSRRIITRARRLPASPSRAVGDETSLADEENRRVEITTSSATLLLPYRATDTVLRIARPVDNQQSMSPSDSIVIETDTIRLVEKRRTMMQDSVVERFDLIVFPFGKSELTDEHKRVLDIVRERIGTKARVMVEGRTDRIGSLDENARISLGRAEAVASQLEGRIEITGRGEPDVSEPQRYPEERMLQRVVSIYALVPMKR
jgi:outer membrane protein OmpA-like peptidoglycan-associated protein